MTRVLLKIGLASLAFGIGLIAVYLFKEINSNLYIISQKGHSSISVSEKSRFDKLLDSPEMNQRLAEMKKEDFYPTSHGCDGGGEGNGAATSYITFVKKRVLEGASCYSRRQYAKQAVENIVLEAKQVIEVRNRAKNEYGEIGKSWTLLLENDYEFAQSTGRKSDVEIIWYGGTYCYKYIYAPDLETARNLQQYLKK